jgi:hypothetical protein
LKWAEIIAQTREMRNAYKTLVESLNERDNLENPGIVDREIILNWILKNSI